MAAPASEGGAGGKFRKRPFRRTHTTTPYDRPQTALRAATASVAGGGGGWISKLVDPASKIITSGAHRLFASMFRKRLTAPPSPPLPPQEENQESRNKCLETITTVPHGAQESAIVERSNAVNKYDGSSIAEIEQVLKQNTFTRSEIERLMGLLHARTLDTSVVDTVKRPQANYSELVTVQDKPETIADMPVLENESENHRIAGVTSTPVVSSRVLEEDIASPADLAKAYMGCRPSKASPSMLGFRSQAFKEDATLLRNTTTSQKSAMLPLQRSSIHSGVPDNGFMTPRSRGRSAIYNMARMPFSRALPVTAQKGPRLTIDGCGVPSSSSSQSIFEQNGFSESRKSVLKRKSSVLGDDVGLGPIRRIRQKSKILSAINSTSHFSGTPMSAQRAAIVGSNAEQLYLPSAQKPLSLDEPKRNVSKKLLEDEDNSRRATSFTPVPPQSRKTAEKIFQHLDNLVTPAKEKSTEAKLAAVRDTSPAKLTSDMLHGRALRSLENLDASKFLQTVQDDIMLDRSSQKQDKFEGNGPIKFFPSERVAPATHNSGATLSINDKVPVKNLHPAIKNAVGSPPQKRAFQMSAHEDNLDLDDENTDQDVPVPGDVLNISVAEGNGSIVPAVRVEEAPVRTEFKPSADSVLNKTTDSRTSGSALAEKGINSTFSTATAPCTTGQSTVLLHSDVSPKATNTDPPLCSFGSEKVNGVHALPFSSSSFVSQSPAFNFAASLNSKPEISNSFANVATEAVQKNPVPGKGDGKNEHKVWESVSKPDSAPSSVASSSSPSPALSTTLPSPTGLFSFATSANNSSLNNGSISSSSIFPSSASAAGGNNCAKSISSNISSVCVSTGGSTSVTNSTTAPSFPLVTNPPSAPIVFGGTLPASDSPIPVTSGGDITGMDTKAAEEKTTTGVDAKAAQEKSTTVVDTKAAQEETTAGMDAKAVQEKTITRMDAKAAQGKAATFNFGVTSAISSGGSSLYGFSSAPPPSTANNPPQGTFHFGSGSGSVGISQAPSSGTDVSSFTQSIPCQFGSSGSSPVFGSTAFSSSSSVSGSSNTASSVFGSAINLGSSSSAPASSPNPTSSTSSTSSTASVFGSTWQSNKTPIFSSASKSTVPSPGFSFGLSQVPTPSSGLTPTSFSSSSTASTLSSMFSFTSASTATPSFPSSNPSQPVFGNPNLAFASGAAPGNNDQMSLEDSMAEDNVQASSPAFPSNVQSSPTPTPGFMFNSPAPSGPPSFQFGGQQQNPTTSSNPPFQFGGQQQNQTGPSNSPFQFGGQQQNQTAPANSLFQFGGQQQNQTAAPANSPFQFGGRQNQPVPANSSPFEASGSLDFNAGGSFSLGSTGGDKSNRRIIRVKHKQSRKK